MRARIDIAGWAIVVLLAGTSARALVGDSYGDFGLDGSLRTVTAATVNYDYPLLFGPDNPGDGLSQSLLRLTAGGRPADWLSYEIHGVQNLNFSTMGGQALTGGGIFGSAGTDSRYQALDAAWNWANHQDIQTRLWLDRCNLKLVLPFADVTVGRQAVTFGKAYFWNPLDVFLAFDPRQFDRDYKAGVDAVRIDIPTGDFSGINLVAVLGRSLDVFSNFESDPALDASWYGSALLLRAYNNLFDWDVSLQAGKIYGGYQVGGGLSGELGPMAVRGEAAYFVAEDSGVLPGMPGKPEMSDHLTAVLGMGHRFESTLDLEAEFLYNGAGDAGNLEASFLRMGSGGSFHAGRYLLGLVASYEIIPILNGSLAWIFSFSDLSSLLQPGLVLSVSDEADFLFGALIGLGARPTMEGLQSEFGSYPNIYYMEFKFYF